jgi:hypothetical protein
MTCSHVVPYLLPEGPKSIKLLYSIMNLNTISLPTKARPTNLNVLDNLNNLFIELLISLLSICNIEPLGVIDLTSS